MLPVVHVIFLTAHAEPRVSTEDEQRRRRLVRFTFLRRQGIGRGRHGISICVSGSPAGRLVNHDHGENGVRGHSNLNPSAYPVTPLPPGTVTSSLSTSSPRCRRLWCDLEATRPRGSDAKRSRRRTVDDWRATRHHWSA